MKKYYEDAKYNAAFVRCVDVMSQMLQKYGHQVLDEYYHAWEHPFSRLRAPWVRCILTLESTHYI